MLLNLAECLTSTPSGNCSCNLDGVAAPVIGTLLPRRWSIPTSQTSFQGAVVSDHGRSAKTHVSVDAGAGWVTVVMSPDCERASSAGVVAVSPDAGAVAVSSRPAPLTPREVHRHRHSRRKTSTQTCSEHDTLVAEGQENTRGFPSHQSNALC